jgi:hypothetical protein
MKQMTLQIDCRLVHVNFDGILSMTGDDVIMYCAECRRNVVGADRTKGTIVKLIFTAPKSKLFPQIHDTPLSAHSTPKMFGAPFRILPGKRTSVILDYRN